MAVRGRRSACAFGVGLGMALVMAGCHRDGPSVAPTPGASTESPSAATAAPAAGRRAESGSTARVEPMRLPFEDFAPSAGADPYTYTRQLPSGCALAYQRWWGIPPDSGPPVALESVRSARLRGAAVYALVHETDAGESRVWRRGAGYQVALDFVGCAAAEVDAILAESEALPSPRLDGELPAAERVCVGPRASASMHTATPSRAGVFDPGAPIQGEHLNWMAPGVGCVTYPALSSPIPCGDGRYPWVATTLCQQ